jgi:hypothetical protein
MKVIIFVNNKLQNVKRSKKNKISLVRYTKSNELKCKLH